MSTKKTTEVWSELHPEIISDGLGQIKRVINVDAVKASIDNILRTRPGERVMLPQFGSPLHSFLFETMINEELNHIVDQLKAAVELWDDRVEITEMSIYKEPDKGQIFLEALFRIRGNGQIFKYTINVSGEMA